MAQRIDITDFAGVVTNADLEDLRPDVLTALRNLRPVNGKLIKTFGIGEFTSIPAPVISAISTKLGGNYTVQNVFVFNSEYLSSTETHRNRYIVVVADGSNNTRVLWWDYDAPAVSSVLVFNPASLYFSTAAAHRIDINDYVLVQSVKDNNNVALNLDKFDQAGSQSTTTEVYFNAPAGYGGSWINVDDGNGEVTSIKPSLGGKMARNIQLGAVDIGTISDIEHIGAIDLSGNQVVSLIAGRTSSGTYSSILAYANASSGTDYTNLVTTNWTNIQNSADVGTTPEIHYIRTFNGSFYAVIKYTTSSRTDTVLLKVTPTWNGSSVTWSDSIAQTITSYSLVSCQLVDFTINHVDYLIALYNNGASSKLISYATNGSITDYSTSLPANTIPKYLAYGDDSNGNTYFFIGFTHNAHAKLYRCLYSNLSNSNPWTDMSNYDIVKDNTGVIAMDQYIIDGIKTAVICLEDSTNNTHKIYAIDGSNGFALYQLNNALPTSSNGNNNAAGNGHVLRMYGTHPNPAGKEYLYIAYDVTPSGEPSVDAGGTVYYVDGNNAIKITECVPLSVKRVHCFCDVTTNYSMTYAKAFMVLYGTEYKLNIGTIFRHSDVGWVSGAWAGNGSLVYQWRDLLSFFNISGTFQQTINRNPIVPMGDSLRILPGDLSNGNEMWIGYIDRTRLATDIITAQYYGEKSSLTNPFTIAGSDETVMDKDIRPETGLKYALTAIYDGLQETLINDEDILTPEIHADIKKSVISLTVKVDTSTLNKRITGFNVYRAGLLSDGHWGSFALIKAVDFVGDTYTQATPLPARIHAADDSKFWIKDNNNSDLFGLAFGTSTPTYKMRITGAYNGSSKRIENYSLNGNIFYQIKPIWYKANARNDNAIVNTVNSTSFTVDSVSEFAVGQYIMVSTTDFTSNKIGDSNAYMVHNDGSASGDQTEVMKITAINTETLTITVERSFDRSSADAHDALSKIYIYSGIVQVNLLGASGANIYDAGWRVVISGSNNDIVSSSGAFGAEHTAIIEPINDEGEWNTNNAVDITKANGSTFFGADITDDTKEEDNIVKAAGHYNSNLGLGFVNMKDEIMEGDKTVEGVLQGDLSYEVSGTTHTITITDNGLPEGSYHYNEGEKSIKCSGKYAKIFNGRMFLLNLKLDIGDENEEHRDWLAYSEMEQFDVRSVSNIIAFSDREGGAGTGLAELYGDLIIFKPRAIFTLKLTDLSQPSTWQIRESKHNIGNIAPQGIVEAIDSVYFVFYDGIYRLDPNFAAAADATPSILNRITEPIKDIFEAIGDKTTIKGGYEQDLNEVVYTWTRNNAQEFWAYNIYGQTWRQLSTAGTADMFFTNENGNLDYYDSTNKKIHTFSNSESSKSLIKTKRFPLNMDRKTKIRHAAFQYNGNDNVTVKVYVNGESSPTTTHTLTGTGRQIRKVPLKRYGNAVQVEMETAQSANNFELERIQIETE